MPKVWNKSNPKTPDDAVYVGRPTKWGNPWSHKVNSKAAYYAKDREDAINKFAEYLAFDAEGKKLAEDAKRELKGKDLVCWCAPLSCHADELLRIANEE